MSVNEANRPAMVAGVLLVAAGAVCYGLLPLPLEILRDEGVGSTSSLLVRFGVSLVVLGAIVAWRRCPGGALSAPFFAGLGIGAATIFLFEGYARLPASTTILVFYTYPAFTLVLASLLFRAGMEWRTILAIALVLGAAGLIVTPGNLEATPLGALLITFGAPLGYGLYLACLGAADGHVLWRTLVVSMAACVVTLVWHLVSDASLAWPVSTNGWISLGWVGLGTGILATCLVVAGTAMAGSGRSAVAGSAELVTVLLTGWLLFGETLHWQAVAGALAILAAIVVSLPRVSRRSS